MKLPWVIIFGIALTLVGSHVARAEEIKSYQCNAFSTEGEYWTLNIGLKSTINFGSTGSEYLHVAKIAPSENDANTVFYSGTTANTSKLPFSAVIVDEAARGVVCVQDKGANITAPQSIYLNFNGKLYVGCCIHAVLSN